MARTASAIDWETKRKQLGGASLLEWATNRRTTTAATTRDIAEELARLTGEPVTMSKVNNALQFSGVRLTPEHMHESYQARAVRYLKATPRYDNPPQITGDALILNDVQIPYHDYEFMRRCVQLSQSWHIDNLILGGDFADVHALNGFHSRADLNLDEEIDHIEDVLTYLKKRFKHVLWLMGNHEQRIERFMQGKADIWTILRQFRESIEVTDYYYCLVNDNWLVSHPVNTSVHGGLVPGKLADKFGRHVAAGHGHMVGMRLSTDGQHVAIDTGIVADPMKLAYYALRHNTRPSMAQGALIIRKGYPWQLFPGYPTDWAALAKLK